MRKEADIPKGYKKTKVGVIPEEWSNIPLGEITTYTKGYAFKSLDYAEKGLRIIRISDTTHDSIKDDDPIFINDFSGKYDKWKLYQNDLVFTTVGSRPPMYDSMVGKVIKISRKYEGCLLNQNAVILRAKYQKIHPIFLFNNFKRKRYLNFVETIVRGNANQVSITLNDLFSYHIPLPPLPEQQKIAAILSAWDSAIENVQLIIDNLKARNKGLAQQLLTGKKRLKGSGGEWAEVKLDDIAERVTNRNEELNDTVVTISAQRGFVLQEDFFNKRVASKTLSDYYLLNKGEFAYNKSYSNGYPMGAFKRLKNLEKAVVTTLYICFRLKGTVNSNFMEQFFEAGLMIKGLMRIAQEGGRAHGLLNIGLSDFFNLKLTIPPIKEQEAIEQVLSKSIKELQRYEQYLTTLQTQKKGLMQKLLTGAIRVNPVK